MPRTKKTTDPLRSEFAAKIPEGVNRGSVATEITINHEPGKDERKADFRPLGLQRPCACGCDCRAGKVGVGYLTGISNGIGFTLWIKDEATYQAMLYVAIEQNVMNVCCDALNHRDNS